MISMWRVAAAVVVGMGAVAGVRADTLLDWLDLGRPGLEQVKEAHARGDDAAARRALAEYYRTRTNITWRATAPESLVDLTKTGRTVADDAVAHRFVVVNVPWQFAGAIDWGFNPTARPESKVALNHEWTWQFNRHSYWPALARAYGQTKDRRYARELCDEIVDWVAKNPEPSKAQNVPYSKWRTIEAGIRAAGPWPQTFFAMAKEREAFPDEALLAMVEGMGRHADYLERCSPLANSNWTVMESNGLFHVGVLFPEFKDAARWREDGLKRQLDELRLQVYPDGAQVELAPGYHNVSLNNFLGTLQVARMNGVEVPEEYVKRMEGMFDFNRRVMMPDRTLLNFNDSGRGKVVPVLAEGLELFPRREDWRWITSDGKQGREPAGTSDFLPYAGMSVMRSGWGRGAVALGMDAGPWGAAHQHEDKLNFILDAYGSHLVAECGIFTYDASEMRKYCLGPWGHNEGFVDGLGQNRRRGGGEYIVKEPQPVRWKSNGHFDYLAASFGAIKGETWGPDRRVGFVHTRRVLFVKPGYFIVADTLTPADEQEHRFETIFHLDAADADVDGQTKAVVTRNGQGKANLAVLPLAAEALQVRVVRGQEKPTFEGWVSDDAYGRRAVPTPGFSIKGKGRLGMVYLFVPVEAGRACRVNEVKAASEDGAILAGTYRDETGECRVVLSADGALRLRRGDGTEFAGAQ